MVEPDSFLIIKLSTGFTAMAQVKQFYQFIHRHEFLIVTRIPTQQSQEINHCLRQITRFTVSGRHFTCFGIMPFQWEYGKTKTVTVTLAQLTVTFRLQQQRQVGKGRHRIFPTKSTVQQHVQRCRGQPFFTTNHMGNLHQMVVYNICQMIGRKLIC